MCTSAGYLDIILTYPTDFLGQRGRIIEGALYCMGPVPTLKIDCYFLIFFSLGERKEGKERVDEGIQGCFLFEYSVCLNIVLLLFFIL